jgi:hypothetical protein
MTEYRMLYIEAGHVRGLNFFAFGAEAATARAEVLAREMRVYLLTVKRI